MDYVWLLSKIFLDTAYSATYSIEGKKRLNFAARPRISCKLYAPLGLIGLEGVALCVSRVSLLGIYALFARIRLLFVQRDAFVARAPEVSKFVLFL
jgi:hypothetical protein